MGAEGLAPVAAEATADAAALLCARAGPPPLPPRRPGADVRGPSGMRRVSRASVLSPRPRPGPPLRAGRKRGLDQLFQRGSLSLQSGPQKPQEEAAAFPLVWRGYWWDPGQTSLFRTQRHHC